METLLESAREYYKKVNSLLIPENLKPSQFWYENNRSIFSKIINRLSTSNEAIYYAQELGWYNTGLSISNSSTSKIIAKYNKWLESQGTPLSGYDKSIQESDMTNPKYWVTYEGRKVSLMFYFYLCCANRILRNSKKPIHRILELGSGYGGLARIMRLFIPEVQYIFLDMNESLFFSYLYIRANFPEAKCKFVTEKEELLDPASYGNCDFVFVPIALIQDLEGLAVDLVINIASLGEMGKSAMERYMKFIHEDIHTKYFYSLNRYGRYPFNLERFTDSVIFSLKRLFTGETTYCASPNMIGLITHMVRGGANTIFDFPPREWLGGIDPDLCRCSVVLDPFWNICMWDFLGKDNFSHIFPLHSAYLEVLAERGTEGNYDERVSKAKELFEMAAKTPKGSHPWHYLIWDSVRIHPSEMNLKPFLEFLNSKGYLEYGYYHDLYAQLNHKVPAKS